MGTEKKNRSQRDEEATGSVNNSSGNNSGDTSASLAARRAKLRGALGQKGQAAYSSEFGSQISYQEGGSYASEAPNYGYGGTVDNYIEGSQDNSLESAPVNVYGVPLEVNAESETSDQDEPKLESVEPVVEPSPEPRPRIRKGTSQRNTSEFEAAPPVQTIQTKQISSSSEPGSLSDKTVELVNSIDQSLNVCATNLANLQSMAGEQTEVLKGLASTLQNQTLLEIGLNLNSLTESLTAALEPMKSIGELVPALDTLVATLESREQKQTEKLSPDQLVTSLSDQLSAGLIDPWTFKCAYMAVYPADHPADLLHRLVELLGSQRLSGDLFRAAYEAVQAAEPPARLFPPSSASSTDYSQIPAGAIDEGIRAQLENLERANRDLQRRQDEREAELMQVLAQKEAELQEAQEALSNRMEDLNNRYSEAAEMLAQREEEYRAAIESKDLDLIEKDAELNMLRAQMEELRFQTEDMVKDLQKEMIALREAQIASSSGHDQSSSSNAQGFFESGPQPPARSGLFESGPSKPVFSEPGGNFAPQENSSGGFGQAPQDNFAASQVTQSFQAPPNPGFQPAATAPVFQAPQPALTPAPPSPPQGNLAPPTTSYSGGQSGSYGMGVRQQVFEVIVRQALAGAPWREICAGPMSVNNIKPEEVEAEVKRRQSML